MSFFGLLSKRRTPANQTTEPESHPRPDGQQPAPFIRNGRTITLSLECPHCGFKLKDEIDLLNPPISIKCGGCGTNYDLEVKAGPEMGNRAKFAAPVDMPNPFPENKSFPSAGREMPLDAHGQPPLAVNRELRAARDSSEALGVIRGLIADGDITSEKANFLRHWLAANEEFAAIWPFNELRERVFGAVVNGDWPALDLLSIHDLIRRIVGIDLSGEPTTLPLTMPVPEVVFRGREFVLTGRFSQARKICEGEIESRGGICKGTVTRDTDYLVIGIGASRDWATTSWGNKIFKAAEYAANPGKKQLFIITETTWRNAINSTDRVPGTIPIAVLAPAKVSIDLRCPHCQGQFRFRSKKTRKKIFCPDCRQELSISQEIEAMLDSIRN